MFVSFSPTFSGPAIPAWIDGWAWDEGRWALRVVKRQRGRWTLALQNPMELHKMRAFEPSTPGMKTLGTESRPFEIRDLSALAPLIEPREVLGPMLSGAASADHAVYALEFDATRLLFPAWLLIDHLWVWSAKALRALLVPNSLDVLMQGYAQKDGTRDVRVTADLASAPVTKVARSRITWLATSDNARESWGSILNNAYAGRLDAKFPKASIRGWLWGVEINAGLLACELSSVDISFDIPDAMDIRVGRKLSREVQP